MSFSLGLFETQILLAIGLIVITLAATLLSIYLASKRLKHKKLRLLLVTFANITLAAAIMGLAFNLQLNHTAPDTSYLVTSGAQTKQLKDIDSSQVIYVLNKPTSTLSESLAKHSIVQLDSVSQLFDLQPDIQNLQIMGSGLSKQQWQDLEVLFGDKLNEINMTFLPTEPELGLVDVTWQKERVEGQFIQLNGRLQGADQPPETIYELSLIDPIGEVIQVVRLKAQEHFSFNFSAKSVGQWIYQLQLKQANQTATILAEPVAFNVRSAPVVKMLIKQAAPSFETRQLTNWASTFNAKMTVLTKISKDKDIRQNFNLDAKALATLDTPLSQKSLDYFDLLLIDGRSLLALSNDQMLNLKNAVKSGLGLYILLDQSLIDAWPSASLNWLTTVTVKPLNSATYSAIPHWQNSRIEQSIALVKAELLVAQNDILVTSHLQQPLVTNSIYGMGRVAMSLINNTYGWQTAGLNSEYSHFWQHIIFNLARPQTQSYWLEPQQDKLQFALQRHQACKTPKPNDKTLVHQTNHHQYQLLAVSAPLKNEQACVTTWLTPGGWHHLQLTTDTQDEKQDNSISIYAYAHTDWQTYQHVENVKLTQQKIAKLTSNSVNQEVVKDLPKEWLWWCLVIASTLLWLERKTFS